MLDKKVIECELCIIGGGMSGLSAAISAAREGVKVVLMHERPVLGGNASSEIRMWISHARGEDNRETGILEEIYLESLYRNPTKNYHIWDTILYDFVKREKNITLLLNCTCMDAKTEEGNFPHGREKKIISVTGYQMTTQRFIEVRAKYFCDSSGDSILAPLTGAEFRIGREAASEFGEDTTVEVSDNMTMGMSCLIQGRETHREVKYIPPECATKLCGENFENRNPDIYTEAENFWYLELGGDRDSIGDTEEIRDELLGLATGTWDYIKNSGEFESKNWELDFLGFLPGKRESRRYLGEYMITQRDISDGCVFEDEIAFGGWPLDDHYPGGFYHKGVPNTDVQTPAPYSIPYRALYSKNVDNLFFAGRNISMTHFAMSSMRVMATCTLLGEAVGKAASIAVKEDITPHDVYLDYINELQELLLCEDCFLPSKKREISGKCLDSELNIGYPFIRNGEDRAHRIYGTDEKDVYCAVAKGSEISYSFAPQKVASVHIVFDSDLNRNTLPGGAVEKRHITRANVRLDVPVMHMPKTLCREFVLLGELEGERYKLFEVSDNRKRAYHINLDKKLDKLILIPRSTWGDYDNVSVISFDFK
ncbi:MAG: FAD-dependent oxidoreductase [Oscillospiraceae bacterium]|nr:FAD-dependent oxidoreductase [Oscillospiraceae bacterium]